MRSQLGRPRNADGHRTRLELLRVISTQPGLSRNRLATTLGVSRGSVRFHARQLAAIGAIRIFPVGRTAVHVRSDVPTPLLEMLCAYANPTAAPLLETLRRSNGLTAANLAKALQIPAKTARANLKRLEAAGLAKRQPGHRWTARGRLRDVEAYLADRRRESSHTVERFLTPSPSAST